ncbi:MAG TPA: CesT family type III secretion system chaperone [Parachlamydiaceae bacterium]|nr:CesT family type III secretion system chaperone [Parachlamydiaceae bacterium]
MDKQQEIKIVNSWLQDMSTVLGADLSLDSEGLCSFQIGQDVFVIEVSHDFPMVTINSTLMALPIDNKELSIALMSKSLELNAFQILTRGGAIAMAPGGGLLIYCYSTPITDLDSVKFSNILGAFFDSANELKRLLLETHDESASLSKIKG